jgi:hypothetical protein
MQASRAQAKTGQAMNVDDRYRARLQSAIAALRYWTPSIADQATIAETVGDDYWEIDSAPHTQGACPFELVLRSDGKHNLVIASETHEDETTDNFDLFVPLLSAIARGQVTRRITTSAATRMPLAIVRSYIWTTEPNGTAGVSWLPDYTAACRMRW